MFVIMVITRTRQSMNTNKAAKRDGKARSTFNVSERHTFVHAEYDIILKDGQIGPTGLLVVARLKPKNATIGTWPEFVLRWDERDNLLDVDPVNVSGAEKSLFKEGTNNYYGHHASKFRSGPRVFEVDIGWNGQSVYCGEIRFSLAREVETKSALGLRPSVSESSSKENG